MFIFKAYPIFSSLGDLDGEKVSIVVHTMGPGGGVVCMCCTLYYFHIGIHKMHLKMLFITLVLRLW